MTARVLSMPLNSVATELHDPTAAERELLELVREAILRTVRSQKAAAIELGVDVAQLSRQLSGLERLPLTLLARSPRILAEFAALLAKSKGFELRRPTPQTQRKREIRDRVLELARLWLEEELENTEVKAS